MGGCAHSRTHKRAHTGAPVLCSGTYCTIPPITDQHTQYVFLGGGGAMVDGREGF